MRNARSRSPGQYSGFDSAGRRQAWQRLRGELWLNHAIHVSNLTPDAFERRFIYRNRSRSNLFRKWCEGQVVPQRVSATQLEKVLPGTLRIFDLPLFPLLADQRISLRRVSAVINSFRIRDNEGWSWCFAESDKPCLWSVYRDSTADLKQRGDLWGLFGLVALLREAEAQGDAMTHVEISKEMYRAIPALLTIPWIRPSAPLLRSCVDAIRSRMFFSNICFDVDWSTIMGNQIFEKSTDTASCQDPILSAEIVVGKDVINHGPVSKLT